MAMGECFHTIIMFDEDTHTGDVTLACGLNLDPKDPKKQYNGVYFLRKELI